MNNKKYKKTNKVEKTKKIKSSKKIKKTKKIKNSKKTRLLKTIVIVSISLGVMLILYPVYTNFIAGSRETTVLSAWEDQKKEHFEEVETVDEDMYSPGENEEITLEITGDIAGEATLDYAGLTVEDFFPLKMSIPKIEVEAIVEEGTDATSLKNGPGYEALTSLPGDVGRCTISGHRTTYGAPFNRIDELENGDLIYLETIKNEQLTYIVTGMEIIKATDIWILEGTGKRELILTTCHPKYSAARRLVIIAELLEVFPFNIKSKA